MNHVNEAQLVRKVMAGDRAALGDLLSLHQHRLFNVCLRMVNHRDDAAELAQESMLKIVEHISDYNGRAKITTWMIRITMNQCISHLRKRRLRRHVSLDAPGSGGSGGGGTGGASGGSGGDDQMAPLRDLLAAQGNQDPVSRVQQGEMVDRLYQALDTLDADFRAVIVLRDLHDMDYGQMADSLGVPVGTVKSRLFRARVALREAMLPTPAGTRRDAAAPEGANDG